MAIWLRVLCVIVLAAFAAGTFAQTAQATTMDLRATMSASDGMGTAPSCDHCKPGTGHHAVDCDGYCLTQALAPLPFLQMFRNAAARVAIEAFWGFEGPSRSPTPPPPRAHILS